MTTTYTPIAELPLAPEYAQRLTLPLRDGWVIVGQPVYGECDTCGRDAEFITQRATDCDVWGLVGINGSYSDVYAVYCAACAYVNVSHVRHAMQNR